MKKIFKSISMLMVASLLLVSCVEDQKKSTPEVNITTVVGPSDGLDLKLVGQLLQKGEVKNAKELEKVLNKDGGINNLDLNTDGKVDYINVSENKVSISNKIKSFDLTTGQDSSITHLATIEIEQGKSEGEYNINMSGSESVYGAGHHYNTSVHSTGNMLFYAWLFSPRAHYYHSPYYYGHYPSYYRGGGRTVVNNVTYVNRTSTQRTTASKSFSQSSTSTTKAKSTNKGKVSKSTRTSINNHKTQVKKMKTRRTATAAKQKAAKQKAARQKSARQKANRSKSSGSKSRSRSRSRSRSGGRRSDVNYKTNITQYDNGLETVMKLNSVYYYWSPMENFNVIVGGTIDTSRQVGFIAQNVKKVIPEIVNTDKYGLVVNYDLLVPVLVKAIQTQQIQIEKLQTQINNLK